MNTQEQQRLATGTLISDRYRIKSVLGRGGFATVYEVEHVHLLTPFALKVLDLPIDPHASTTFSRRFMQEAQFAAKLRHPNVVQTTDFGLIEQTGQPFLVMEKLNGRDLDDELKVVGALTTARALRLFDGCLSALGRGHELGIVHKDLKPSNLFLVDPGSSDERLIVLDFGIARAYTDPDAKLTHTQNIAGTPAYLAPEYIQSQQVSPALDVYQMGLIIAESLMGVHPMDADTAMAYLMKHCMGQFELSPELLTSPLGPILQRAMSLEPELRWKNASELRQALNGLNPRELSEHYLLPEDHRLRRKRRGQKSENLVANTAERHMSSDVFAATVAGQVPLSHSKPTVNAKFSPGVDASMSQAPLSAPISVDPVELVPMHGADSTTSAVFGEDDGAEPPNQSKQRTLAFAGLLVFGAVVLAGVGLGLVIAFKGDGAQVKPPDPNASALPTISSGDPTAKASPGADKPPEVEPETPAVETPPKNEEPEKTIPEPVIPTQLTLAQQLTLQAQISEQCAKLSAKDIELNVVVDIKKGKLSKISIPSASKKLSACIKGALKPSSFDEALSVEHVLSFTLIGEAGRPKAAVAKTPVEIKPDPPKPNETQPKVEPVKVEQPAVTTKPPVDPPKETKPKLIPTFVQ